MRFFIVTSAIFTLFSLTFAEPGKSNKISNLDFTKRLKPKIIRTIFAKHVTNTIENHKLLHPERIKYNIEQLDGLFKDKILTRLRSGTPIPSSITDDVKNIISERLRKLNANPRTRSLGLNCKDDNCKVPISLSGLWGYGCWCNFGADLLKGHGIPVNKHDEACQSMQQCLRCAVADAEDDGSYTCDPQTQDFNVAFALTDEQLEASCETQNPNDACAIHMCMCQVTLIADLVDLIFAQYDYDPFYRHSTNGGTYDYDLSCPTSGDGNASYECCGGYPRRSTYNDLRDRACCDSTTLYNELSQQCCPGTGVSAIGDICV